MQPYPCTITAQAFRECEAQHQAALENHLTATFFFLIFHSNEDGKLEAITEDT